MTRLVGLVFAVVGAVLGLAPAALALHHASWLLWIAAVLALFYAGAVSRISKLRQPLVREGLVTALGISAYGPALGGVLVLLAYLGGSAMGALVEWIWGLFVAPPNLSGSFADWLAAAALLLMALPMVAVSITSQVQWLSRPREQRAEAAARLGKEARWWSAPVVGAVLILVAAGLYAAGYTSTAPFVLLQIALVFLCTPASQIFQFARQRESARSAPQVVRSLLESLGFEVLAEMSPAVKGESAPLVRKLDFVARRGGEVLCVEVKGTAEEREPLTWSAVTALSLAAWTLASSEGRSLESIRALLVVVAEQADPRLEKAANDEGVALMRLSSQELVDFQSGGAAVRATLSTRLSAALQPSFLAAEVR